MFDSELMKQALAKTKGPVVEDPGMGPLRLLSSTVGRAQAAPSAALIGQEKALQWLAGPDEAATKQQAGIMGKAFPRELEGVKVRTSGTDIIDDLKRTWTNPRTGILMKGLGTLTAVPTALSTAMSRSDHYNPVTDVAQIYSGIPQVTGHELGHAVDFNKKSPLARSAYTAAGGLERGALLGFPGPLTHWMEMQANKNYLAALGKQPDKAMADDMKRQAWRRLTPAYATYGMASLLGGTAALNRPLYDKVTGGAQNVARDLLGKVTSQETAKSWAPLLAGLGLTGVATLAGRGVGEVRNALTPRPKADKPDKKPDKKPAKKKSAEKKAGLFGANATADEGGDSAPARVGSPMRGWQWKVLQGQQQQALQSWMPRMVKSEATPLTQLLASPGKQSLIGAGVGGLLGGGAGIAAGQLIPKYLPDVPMTPETQGILAAGGLGLGALYGASKAYGSRRRKNDRIIDALRRTPPGATVRDYDMLQAADAEANKKLGL